MSFFEELFTGLKALLKLVFPSTHSSVEIFELPETHTPLSVRLWMLGIVVVAEVVFFLVLGLFWSVTLLLIILAFTTHHYIHSVPSFEAHVVLNNMTAQLRVLYQGSHQKLFWEELQDDHYPVDLKMDLKEVKEETWNTLDGQVKGRMVYGMKVDTSGPDRDLKVIRFSSAESEAIRMKGKSIFFMLASNYFKKKKGDDLVDMVQINKDIFETDPGKSLIAEFEKKWGVVAEPLIEDLDPSAKIQEAKDSVSKANSFREIVHGLMFHPDEKPTGMARVDAEKRAAQLLGLTVDDFNITLNATGLENLEHVSLGSLPTPKGKGGKP